MKDTQDKIGYCQLSLGLLYEDSTEYDNSGEVYPTSKQEISHMKNTNRFVVHEKLLETIMEDAMVLCQDFGLHKCKKLIDTN